MDEFDVFMDAMSRNIAIKSVIEFAAEFDKRQFIFITPQVGHCNGDVDGLRHSMGYWALEGSPFETLFLVQRFVFPYKKAIYAGK